MQGRVRLYHPPDWGHAGAPSDRMDFPDDFNLVHEVAGAMCGHGAFAAAVGISVREACVFFPKLKAGITWVNIPDMEAALCGLRRSRQDLRPAIEWSCRVAEGQLPQSDRGLLAIQWEGSWMSQGAPPAARCCKRHWAAFRRDPHHGPMIWDVNWSGSWQPLEDWDDKLSLIYPKRAMGHHIFRNYSIQI